MVVGIDQAGQNQVAIEINFDRWDCRVEILGRIVPAHDPSNAPVGDFKFPSNGFSRVDCDPSARKAQRRENGQILGVLRSNREISDCQIWPPPSGRSPEKMK